MCKKLPLCYVYILVIGHSRIVDCKVVQGHVLCVYKRGVADVSKPDKANK